MKGGNAKEKAGTEARGEDSESRCSAAAVADGMSSTEKRVTGGEKSDQIAEHTYTRTHRHAHNTRVRVRAHIHMHTTHVYITRITC